MQLKYNNYVAFSHVHGVAVNNSGYSLIPLESLNKLIVNQIKMIG